MVCFATCCALLLVARALGGSSPRVRRAKIEELVVRSGRREEGVRDGQRDVVGEGRRRGSTRVQARWRELEALEGINRGE